jgi:flagellar motor switch protein FliG
VLAAQAAPTVDQIRSEARSLLQSMCGDQCDVVEVSIRQRRVAPASGGSPGFEDGQDPRVAPSDVQLSLLFDSNLDKRYRDFVSERVRQRIAELGLPVLVRQQAEPFPTRPEPPVEPPPPPVWPVPPPPPPVVVQPPIPPPPAPTPKTDLSDALLLRLIEALPLLLSFVLLAFLVIAVLRRMEAIAAAARAPRDDDVPTLTPEVVESEPPRGATLPPPTKDELSRDLERHRGSTRRVFRRLLTAGDYDTVARSVALLGDFVVQDVSFDPALRRELAAAGTRTAEILRNPITEEEKEELLRTVHAELVADRVAHRSDDVRDDFEMLLAWSPEAFAAMMGRLDPRLQIVLLRHAPQHLSERFLDGLEPRARTRTVAQLLEAPPADPEELDALTESMAGDSRAALVGGYEADHIVDLIDALPADEQDAVLTNLESTRPDYVRRNLGQLPVESALLRVSDGALGAAWVTVPFEDWIDYLRAAPQAIRERSLSTCPARLRESVSSELELRVAADPARAKAARRRIVQAALRAADVVQRKQVPAKVPPDS